MSVVLLSDGSGQRTSDEHQAFDLSAGRTLLPLAKPERPQAEPPADPTPEPSRPAPPPPAGSGEDQGDDEPWRDFPVSTYLPATG